MRPKRRALVRACALAAGVLIMASCNNPSSNFTVSPLCLSFSPNQPPAPGTVVARAGAGSTCNRIEIELVGSGVTNVFSAAFTVTIANFTFVTLEQATSPTAGPFLTLTGTEVACDSAVHDGVFCHVQPDPAGTFTVGISRTDVMQGTDAATAGEVLATLSFLQISGVGMGALTFSDARLQDASMPPVDLLVPFHGGLLVVQ